VVYLHPCSSASLEITGHYDDGVARDLSQQPGLSFTFADGHAAQSGPGSVVLNDALDDTLTVTFDGVDSAPVPITAIPTDDASSCGATTTTPPSTTLPPSSTSSSSTTTLVASTTTSSAPEGSTTTTAATPTSTTTTPPGCRGFADCDDGDACTDDA